MTEADIENKNVNEIKKTFIEENRKVTIPYFTYEEEDQSQLPSKIQIKGKIPIFDLNQIFKFNFSYNFDLLKSLLESLINNQQETQKELLKVKKESDLKMNELERRIIDMKIAISDPNHIKELELEKGKLQKESEKMKNTVLQERNLEEEKKEYSIKTLEVKYILK